MKEILINGLLDTVFGMGVVFVLLIFLAWIIGLLKFIPVLIDKLNNKEKSANISVSQSVEKTISQIETKEQESIPATNEIDDRELVAVITAAIMASMGESAPADGLIVRSIKKVNKTAWTRA